MPEERQEVKTYWVKYRCPKCKTGFLSHGDTSSDGPGHYHNVCNNQSCKHAELLTHKYPFSSYKPITETNVNS